MGIVKGALGKFQPLDGFSLRGRLVPERCRPRLNKGRGRGREGEPFPHTDPFPLGKRIYDVVLVIDNIAKECKTEGVLGGNWEEDRRSRM